MEKRYEGWGISEAVTQEVTKTKELQRIGEIKALALDKERKWKTEARGQGSKYLYLYVDKILISVCLFDWGSEQNYGNVLKIVS